jgi:CRISPR-associated exonuclease Cas4
MEQAFEENIHTMRGQAVHAKVDSPGVETREGLRVERALSVWNDRLGLIGKADVVEFLADGTPYPVEYKHGHWRKAPHIAAADRLQLAAQALCLEEMTGRTVPEGALFYAGSKRRIEVEISPSLRQEVSEAADAIRAMLAGGQLPTPANDARCKECSLKDICQPEALSQRERQTRMVKQLFADQEGDHA